MTTPVHETHTMMAALSCWLARVARLRTAPRKGDVGQRVVGDEEMVVMENGGDENV